MLSSIHPLGERIRGHRFATTALWFAFGSLLGGLAIGALAGSIGRSVHAFVTVPVTVTASIACAGAVVALLLDLGVGPVRIPTSRRQVDEDWLDRYRGWVYGGGFGFQLGLGVATIMPSATVHLTLVLAALTGSTSRGAIIGAAFGLGRALALIPAAPVQTPAQLRSLHERIAAIAPRAHRLTLATLGGIVATSAALSVGAIGGS